jgi:hypothetical protein
MKDPVRGRKGGVRRYLACIASAVLGLGLVVLPAAGQDRPADQAHWQTAADDYRGLPSPATALTLSAVGTAAAIASCVFAGKLSRRSYLGYIAIVPLLAGPSLGAMYGGCWGRAWLWTGLRTAGLIMVVAIVQADFDHDEGPNYVLIGGMALSAIIEMATVGKAVRKHNDRLLARRGLNVGVSPFALPKGAGVQLRLSF